MSTRASVVNNLTPTQRETAETVSAAITGAATTVAVVLVATAGAPAALPLAFVMQKAVLFTNIGGAPTNPTLAGIADNMQFVQGRVGIFSFGDSSNSGRRLSTDVCSPDLRDALLQSVTDFLLFFPFFLFGHALILYGWWWLTASSKTPTVSTKTSSTVSTNGQAKVPATDNGRRKFNTKASMRKMLASVSQFNPSKQESDTRVAKPLPGAFVFNNFEVLLLNFFAGGIMEASMGVIAGFASHDMQGCRLSGALLALAIGCVTLIVFFFVHEFLRLKRFYRLHADALWTPSPSVSPSEIDDPILLGMSVARVKEPTLRLRGVIDPPEEDIQEPARTKRALGKPLKIWTNSNAGEEYEKLSCWLTDVAGHRGVFYQYVRSVTSLVGAFITGASATTLSVHVSTLSIVGIQILGSGYCLFSGHPGDRLEGLVSGIESLTTGANVLLLYIASQLDGVVSAELQAALILAAFGVFFTLCFAVYDSFVLPVMEAWAESPRTGCSGFLVVLLQTSVWTFLIFVGTFVTGDSAKSQDFRGAADTVGEDFVEGIRDTISAAVPEEASTTTEGIATLEPNSVAAVPVPTGAVRV